MALNPFNPLFIQLDLPSIGKVFELYRGVAEGGGLCKILFSGGNVQELWNDAKSQQLQ